jgi:hypothetical protein
MPFFENVLRIQKRNIEYKINAIEKFLIKQDKNLVFIGTIGVGKTTSICSLFDLFDSGGKPILKTGAGATTICEVEIVFGSSNEIRIEPYEDTEIIKFINEYLDIKVGSNRTVDGVPQDLTTELKRAIEYIIGQGVSLMQCRSYIENVISENNYFRENIYNVFINNAGIENRVEKLFVCPENIADKLHWLREKFSELNDGKCRTASLPKKMYVTINANKIKNVIIDTKGIDSNEKDYLRQDFDRYIINEDNLIIYCSSFTAAPDSGIFESIKHYTKKDRDYLKRMILLIIPMHDQPIHVAGVVQDGETDEYKQGLDLRLDVVNQIIHGATQYELKILNHNSKAGSYSKFNNTINDIISYQNDLILNQRNEKQNLEMQLQKIENNELTQEQKNIQKTIQNNINNLEQKLRTFKLNTTDFNLEFSRLYHSNYPAANTKNAINKRLGIYLQKNIYFDFEVLVDKRLQDYLLHNQVKALFQQELGITHDIILYIIPSIYEDFENRFRIFKINVIKKARTYFEDQAYKNEFWNILISRWGGGPGYNIDVQNRLMNKMSEINMEKTINDIFTKHWNSMTNQFISDLR